MERNSLSEYKIDKELVKKRFARSAESYSEYAVVQQRMAANLIQKLVSVTDTNNYNRIFDIGCGDGTLTKLLLEQFQPETVIANDIVEDFQQQIEIITKKHPATNLEFIAGDIECKPLPDNIDLIASNAVFQWLNHLEEFYIKLSKNIKPSSIIAFTTFGINTLPEIRQITGHSLNYLPFAEHCILLRKHFNIISAHEETDIRYFDNPLEILKHLKQMGVNAIKPRHWKRRDLIAFTEEYIQYFSHNNKVSLTYNPLYFILEAKQKAE
jgi:malonyl-ACP O-methyltransferase BioC